MGGGAATMLAFGGGTALLLASFFLLWARPPSDSSRAPLDWAEALFLTAVSALAVIGWSAVVLASLGRFSPAAVGACAATASAVPWLFGRRRGPLALSRPGREEVWLAALLVACAAVYLRPHEYVLGGNDAGTYMNVATTIARTGGLVVHDDWVRLASEHGDVSLRRMPKNLRPQYVQFVGWYVDDADASRILPQFLPLHPALVALAVALAGLRAGLYVTPLWSIAGIAALYFAVRRLFNARTALLAAALLAATPTEIFFARYPTAEPLTLLLIFVGLLGYQHLRDGERRSVAFGLLAGAAFGEATLARADLPVVLVPVVVALVVERVGGRWGRGWTAFGAVLALLLAHAALHGWLIAWPYLWNLYEAPVRAGLAAIQQPGVIATAAAALVLFAVAAWARLRSGAATRNARRAAAPGIASPATLRTGLAALVIALSAYAYFIRPLVEPIGSSMTWPSGNAFPVLDAENWPRLGWYLTPLGLALATAGLALILRRAPLGRAGLFVAVGSLATILYVWRIFSTPYHIYAMRRYVPVVIPALVVFAAVAIEALRSARRVPHARLAARGLAALLLVSLLFRSRYVLPQRDFASAVDGLFGLAAALAPRSVVVVAEPSSSLVADTFGPPLRYVFDHPVVPLRQGGDRARQLLERVLARAREEGRPVQLIAVDPVTLAVRLSFPLRPVTAVPLTLRLLMNTYDSFPSAVQTAHYGVEIYDLLAPGEGPAGSGELLVDVGTLDAAYLSHGFHYKEAPPDQPSGRWTSGNAVIGLPSMSAGPVEAELRARVFAVPGVEPPAVRVLFDAQEVGTFRADVDWRVFRFRAEARPVLGLSNIALSSATFNPARLGLSSDGRDLGVFVDWVRVRPVGPAGDGSSQLPGTAPAAAGSTFPDSLVSDSGPAP